MSPFLPSTLAEWVALLVQLALVGSAISGFVWRVVRQPLISQINGLGERVKVVEMDTSEHEEAIGTLKQTLRDQLRDQAGMHDRQGRLEGAVERIITAMERNRDANSEDIGEIRERLVRIETKLDDMKGGPIR